MSNTLPKDFESFSKARAQGFVKMKELKESGKNVVGVFCTYTPREIFLAADLVSVGLCSVSDETIADAEKVLPRNLCPLIKSSYGFAYTEKCPYMYFSDMIVGETTCDGKKKMYELLGELKKVHIMQLPQRQDDEQSKDMWYKEVLLLKERIEREFNVVITEKNIKEAIKLENEVRVSLKEFSELSKLVPPPITGLEQLKILFGSDYKFDVKEKIEEVKNITKKIKTDYDNGERKVNKNLKRILVTGCPIGGATEKVVSAIEESGGVVVVYENCTSMKKLELLVDEKEADPYRAIADRYLKIGCSIMTPNNRRLDLLSSLIEEYKVDGVIEMTLTACITYNVETSTIRKFLESKKVPFMTLETDYSSSDTAMLKTRAAAFIEMLG